MLNNIHSRIEGNGANSTGHESGANWYISTKSDIKKQRCEGQELDNLFDLNYTVFIPLPKCLECSRIFKENK